MEKCYEYLGCDQYDCIMYGRNDDAKCWEVSGTLCSSKGMELLIKSNKNKCNYCIYFKAATYAVSSNKKRIPITYEAYDDGKFIHAVASAVQSLDEFIKYEIDHANDKRLKLPLKELLEIKDSACAGITREDWSKLFEERKKIKDPPTPHRCAIVISGTHGWDMAKFYEVMVELHYPESVMVFGDKQIACSWLGVENILGKI